MIGLDISHWQPKVYFNKLKGIDFLIHKCTQGTGYVDPKYKERKKEALKNDLIFGSYHFADGGDAQKEAKHYVNNIGDINDGELLVLDWEINVNNPAQWCRSFLDEVYKLTGVKPLLYTNEARVRAIDWNYVVDGDYGLWVASWGTNNGEKPKKEPETGEWPFYAIWQYTSRGRINGIKGFVDKNYTYLDKKTLKKYGYQEKEEKEEEEKEEKSGIDLRKLEKATGINLGGKDGRINQNEADDIADLFESLKKENADLKRSRTLISSEKERLKKENEKLRVENKDLNNQIKDLKTKLNNCEKQNKKPGKKPENGIIKYIRLILGIIKNNKKQK